MTVFAFIRHVASPYRFFILGPIIVMTIMAIDVTLRPYLIKLLIDAVSLHTGQEALQLAWRIAAFYIALQILIPISWRCYDWSALKYEPALKNHIAKTLVTKVGEHSHHYFQNHFAGSIANKINDAATYIPAIIKIMIDRFYANAVILIVALFVLYHVHMWFALAIFIWATFFIAFSYLVIRKFGYLANDVAESASKIVGYIVDFVGNMSSVRFFVGKRQELAKLAGLQDDYLKTSLIRRWFLLKFYAVQGTSFTLYQCACLIMLIYLYSKGEVTPGDFALILTLNMSIMEILWQTADEMRTFSENWGTVDQALKTLLIANDISDKSNATDLKVPHGKIVFDNVQFQYEGSAPLFKNKSISIMSGQKVGLVGCSGSGKSTFVNLMLRLFDVSEGRVLIDDQDIRDVTQESLRQKIGIIPQDPGLFHRTLMENIRYGRENATDAEVEEAAKRAHAHEFIKALPNGYQSLVGERGVKLSGGQRQRIAIARAFLKNAPILILDEATSQLDSITEQYIQESLVDLMQGKTTVVIAHRLSTLMHMDRILVFENGKIVEDGTHQSLIAQSDRYKKLWDAQVGGFLLDDNEPI